MVIQRLQSLFLLLAALILIALCFLIPIAVMHGEVGDLNWYVKDSPALMTLTLTVATLLIVTIFLFRNLRLQMRITLMCIFLMVVLLGVGCFVLFGRMPLDCDILWIGAACALVAGIIFAILAYHHMKKDRNLLRSYDRLR